MTLKGAVQPIAVTVQLPPERHDYYGDLISGSVGLIGALIGAFAAYKFGTKASKDAKVELDRERKLYLSFAVIHKLNKIYPVQIEVNQHISKAKATMAERHRLTAGQRGEQKADHVSLHVSAFSNSLERVSFTSDEIMIAGKVAGKEALNSLMDLDGRYNVTMDLLDTYRAHKVEFGAQANPGGVFDDGYMNFAWTPEQYQRLRPHLTLMDQTVEAIHKNVTEDGKASYDTIVAMIQGRAKLVTGKTEYRVVAPDGRSMIVKSDSVEEAPADPP